ncbi:MAG: Do family serine endopeptidase, partial [Gammaproteobacteria bacterium]
MTRAFSIFAGLFALAGIAFASTAQARDLPDFTGLVEDNAAAVVNISTVRRPEERSVDRPRSRNEELDEFFRRFFPPDQRGDREYRRPRSLGSGFVIGDGFILTNNHVVEGADEILVRFSDRRELNAELVGADPRSDLAVLKVEAEDLNVVTLGDSDKLKVGEWVLAIGSPFGFDYSVTAGIVSAKGRSLPTELNENYVPYLQTDVAINPGNSGGPLFNLDGEVIGINSQIYSNSGGFMGVSFAIPINVAMEVVAQLKETGKVSRGWLGVMIQDVDKNLAEALGLDRPRGALISRVLEGSPAEAGGILEQDIITAINGNEIDFSSELPHFVGRIRAGSTAKVSV